MDDRDEVYAKPKSKLSPNSQIILSEIIKSLESNAGYKSCKEEVPRKDSSTEEGTKDSAGEQVQSDTLEQSPLEARE